MRSIFILTFWLLVNFLAVRAGAAPVISEFSPVAGTVGDQVQLSGSGFLGGGITIRFWNGSDGAVAPILFINSDTVMTVAVPFGITTGPISIQQGNGSQSFTADDFLAVGLGPYIMSFSPAFGTVNDTVAITGVHLGNTTGVKFHGVSATSFTPNAAGTQITTRVPAGATSGVITVSTVSGTSNSPTAFTVVGPGPFITGFSPISGEAGTKVQIDGLHFTGVTNVSFGNKPGIIVSANSDTLLQVLAPTGLLTGPITVRTSLGSSVTSSNFFGKPTITSVSPLSGRAGTNVTIKGKNLTGATAVFFNGVSAPNYSVVNNTNITVIVPVGASSGLVRVVVPGASAFSATNFIVPPTISSFSPAFGPVGTSVTVKGANFNAGGLKVKFNGVQAAAPVNVSFGSLTAQVPVGAASGPIMVTTTNGSDTSATLFYLPAAITSISSTNSPPGTRLLITGQNLTNASAVTFNGASAVFDVTNNSTIGVTVPSNPITGQIFVTTPAGVAHSDAVFFGAPMITSFSPTRGLPGSSVDIKGINFLGATVKFGQLAAAVQSLNNTQIVATVPQSAQTGPISVLGPAGTTASATDFTVTHPSNLQIALTNSLNTIIVGSNLTYTVSILNAGPADAPNVTLTNTLSQNVTTLSVSVPTNWVASTNGNVFTASTPSLAMGDSATISFVVAPQVPGPLTDTITITSDFPDPVPQDNVASVTVMVEPYAALSIDRGVGSVILSWPLALTNYVLQFEDDIVATNWVAVTNAPAVVGDKKILAQTNNSAARFYRLHR